MTKFLFTMNMPSATDNLVHQIIGDVDGANSIDDLKYMLNHADFIKIRQFYSHRTSNNEKRLEDRGDMIINVQHIGKTQEYLEGKIHDAYNDAGRSGPYSERAERTIR